LGRRRVVCGDTLMRFVASQFREHLLLTENEVLKRLREARGGREHVQRITEGLAEQVLLPHAADSERLP
jgi:hypothetical protein